MMEAEIYQLQAADAEEIASLLSSANAGYIRHFHPFPFTPDEIRSRLLANRADRWWGLRAGARMAGIFFLRGWDEGFARPAFGVFIAEDFARQGLARRALAHAVEYCRTTDSPAVMLTVHPENEGARHAYEAAGFRPEGVNPATGHLIYQLSLR